MGRHRRVFCVSSIPLFPETKNVRRSTNQIQLRKREKATAALVTCHLFEGVVTKFVTRQLVPR